MSRSAVYHALAITVCWTGLAAAAHGAEVFVAVAANFTAPMERLAASYQSASGDTLTISFGSSGKLYAQIHNGAPFTVFLSADALRPMKLEEEGLAVRGTRFTYATGRLVLWSANADLKSPASEVLAGGSFRRLAIAEPDVAPYGSAAKAVLEKMDLWEALSGRIVRGEDIGRTFQFVASGAADLGFVALSQVPEKARESRSGFWLVPQELHEPLAQQAVLLKRGESDAPSRAFLDYLRSREAGELIEDFGYVREDFPGERPQATPPAAMRKEAGL